VLTRDIPRGTITFAYDALQLDLSRLGAAIEFKIADCRRPSEEEPVFAVCGRSDLAARSYVQSA
jgi:hypothetical protein